jgi:hypothetical protein
MDTGVIIWKAIIIGVLALFVRIWSKHKDAIIAQLKKTIKKD